MDWRIARALLSLILYRQRRDPAMARASQENLLRIFEHVEHDRACDAVLLRRSAALLRGDRIEGLECPARTRITDRSDPGLIGAIRNCEAWCLAPRCQRAGTPLQRRIEEFACARKEVRVMLDRA
jgi:hypothetical protein